MGQKRIKLELIKDDRKRKATLKVRQNGIIKKVRELSTLCDVHACAIIYSPFDVVPTVWPSHLGVRQVISQFNNMPDSEKNKRSSNHESFLQRMIEKVDVKVKRQQNQNTANGLHKLMVDGINLGDEFLENLSLEGLDTLFGEVETTMDQLNTRIETIPPENAQQIDDAFLIPPENAQQIDDAFLIPPENSQQIDDALLIPSENSQQNDDALLFIPENLQQIGEAFLIPPENFQQIDDPFLIPPENSQQIDDALLIPPKNSQQVEDPYELPSLPPQLDCLEIEEIGDQNIYQPEDQQSLRDMLLLEDEIWRNELYPAASFDPTISSYVESNPNFFNPPSIFS